MLIAVIFIAGYICGMLATFVMLYCGTRIKLARMTAPEKGK